MRYIIVTLEVSKPDKSSLVKFLQSLNMYCISVTISVTFKYSTLNKFDLPLKEQLVKLSLPAISIEYVPSPLSSVITSF